MHIPYTLTSVSLLISATLYHFASQRLCVRAFVIWRFQLNFEQRPGIERAPHWHIILLGKSSRDHFINTHRMSQMSICHAVGSQIVHQLLTPTHQKFTIFFFLTFCHLSLSQILHRIRQLVLILPSSIIIMLKM